jgi:hypothetical protein
MRAVHLTCSKQVRQALPSRVLTGLFAVCSPSIVPEAEQAGKSVKER